MNFRQLQYFVSIVDEGSFLKASGSLHIAQPALSQHIANLEDELNTQLLVRSSRGVKPTAAGDVLYVHAKKIAAQLEQAKEDVLFESNTPKGEVTLVLPPMLSPHVAPKLVQAVDQQYPDIKLRVIEARSLEGHALIESGRVNIGILACASPSNNINGILLYREPLFLVERLADGEQQDEFPPISFRNMSRKPLVASLKKNAVRALLEKTAVEMELPLNFKVEAESARLLRSYVEDGVAAAVLTWSSAHHMLLAGEVSARKIVKPELERFIYLAWPKGFLLNAACIAVKEILYGLMFDLYKSDVVRGEWIEPEQDKPSTNLS